MKIDDLYIFEILIHFYPNLVVKMAKIIPNGCKNDVIFGKNPPSPRHNLKNPSPKPMTSFVNDP